MMVYFSINAVGGAVVDSGGELWAKCIKKRRPEPPFDVLNF